MSSRLSLPGNFFKLKEVQPHKHRHRETKTHIDRQTDTLTQRHTEIQTHSHTDTQIMKSIRPQHGHKRANHTYTSSLYSSAA